MQSEPVGPEWNSLNQFKDNVKPKVITRAGQVIEAVRLPKKIQDLNKNWLWLPIIMSAYDKLKIGVIDWVIFSGSIRFRLGPWPCYPCISWGSAGCIFRCFSAPDRSPRWTVFSILLGSSSSTPSHCRLTPPLRIMRHHTFVVQDWDFVGGKAIFELVGWDVAVFTSSSGTREDPSGIELFPEDLQGLVADLHIEYIWE